MSVIFYEEAVQRLLRSPLGPVGRDLERRSEAVAQKARENSSGPIIGIRNSYLTRSGYDHGALHEGIHVSITEEALGLVASVGTPAEHGGFSYPTFWDQNGRPWLTDALEAARF